MKEKFEAKFQIGKAGLTSAFIENLKSALKTHRQIRISILKSAISERKDIGEIASEIKSKLKIPLAERIIGFTIILVQVRHPRK